MKSGEPESAANHPPRRVDEDQDAARIAEMQAIAYESRFEHLSTLIEAELDRLRSAR